MNLLIVFTVYLVTYGKIAALTKIEVIWRTLCLKFIPVMKKLAVFALTARTAVYAIYVQRII